MQVHEITSKKITEGFWDQAKAAVKGIGSVAAQGINQKLGTNLGGVAAGAQVGPGQRQQAALKLNTGLAAKQAQQLSNQYMQTVYNLMAQNKSQSPTALPAAAQQAVRKEIDRLIFKQLLSNTYAKDLNQLIANTDKSSKPQMTAVVNKINTARRALFDLNSAIRSQVSLQHWTELATAAAEATNLIAFSNQGKGLPPGDITIDRANNQYLYKGQPYDYTNRDHQAAMSQFIKNLKSI